MQGLLHLPWKSHTVIRAQGGKKFCQVSVTGMSLNPFLFATEQLF